MTRSELGAAALPLEQSEPPAMPSSVDLIRLEEQRRFERFIYLGAIGIWLTALLMAGVVFFLEPEARGAALIWSGAFTLLMLGTVSTWALLGRHLASMDQRDAWHKVIVSLHGLLWALPPLIVFAPQQPLITMFMVCMVCGMSAAGVPIFGTRPALYAMIFVPPYVAQIVVFGWHGLQSGDAFHGFMGAAMLLLLTVNLIFSRFTWATLNRSIVLAYENEALVRQLKQQAEQLSEKTRAAEEANTAKTKFLAAASHDLRQPVHALNLFVEVLSGTALDKKQTTMVQHIRAASQASRDMLNTLLDYSRIEAGVMTPKPRPTALAPMLRALEEEFGPQADGRQLVYRTRDTDCVALCDPTMTALVLRNFVSNALRYTHEGGILVCARRRGIQVIVQVMDTGVGIAREHWEEVFKEFRQLGNEERDRQKGLGLGLAIAKGLAQSMGARIELNSRLGHGSVFTLCLPMAQALDDEPQHKAGAATLLERSGTAVRSGGWMVNELHTAPLTPSASASPKQASATSVALAGMKVLVVDDEAPVRLSMQALLQSWGCEVHTAEGLDEALALYTNDNFLPDLLITDYRLREGVTGGDVISALRSVLTTPMPAIIITGDTDPQRIREAASQTATLLHKPISSSVLKEAMVAYRRGMVEVV
jgi:two-component system, sensor histidine kinase